MKILIINAHPVPHLGLSPEVVLQNLALVTVPLKLRLYYRLAQAELVRIAGGF